MCNKIIKENAKIGTASIIGKDLIVAAILFWQHEKQAFF